VSVHDTVSLAENVGVRFKDRHQFVRRREHFLVENAALCLIHYTQSTLRESAKIDAQKVGFWIVDSFEIRRRKQRRLDVELGNLNEVRVQRLAVFL